MTNTNIVISLDTRRIKKDGTFPLIMRLGHYERTAPIPLGISVKSKDWDDENKVISKSHGESISVTRLNNLIQKKKSDAMDVILKLHENGQLQKLSVTDLKAKIDRTKSGDSFLSFGKSLQEDLYAANRPGTAKSYKGTLSIVKKFNKDKDLRFEQINYSFLKKFETDHYSKGNKPNGLAVYLRTIRAIYNKAIKAGVVEEEFYPFTDYKIKTTPTEKRALNVELLKKIILLELLPNDTLFHARNYFVASYMMYGMNFCDMAFLKKTDVKNGRILYQRNKTSKFYDIKITSNLKTILDCYTGLNEDSEYIFPIIKRETSFLQDRDIQWARKRYNKKLKAVAKKCSIETNLTSYVSRHSFATQAMLQDVPLNAISSMLGHSSLKTTQIYLKTLPSIILDDYNSRILGS